MGKSTVDMDKLQEVEEKLTNYRQFTGWMAVVLTIIASGFALLYIVAAQVGFPNPQLNRGLYLGFTLVLSFMLFPATKRWSPNNRISIVDSILIILAIACTAYFIVEYPKMTFRSGMFTDTDLVFSIIAILLCLEATRRVLGWTLPIIAVAFLIYAYFGPYFPDMLAHRGFSIQRIATYQFTTLYGIWGTVTDIFAGFVFLFIIFGTFLERLGAARFFIDLPYAITGRTRGGPAKSAVLVSGLMGSISGSAVANVTTTGTFTIPLMKKTGYRPEVAGGVETAASSGGQMVPPLMGAGAFIIAEFTGVPYWEIVKISIIPALLYFFSLLIMVDFEAAKGKLKGLKKEDLPDLVDVLKRGWFYIVPLVVIVAILVSGKSAGIAGFWAIITTFAIGMINPQTRLNWRGIIDILESAGKKSIMVGSTAGTIGIIIGVVYLTGLGLKFSEIVMSLSQGHLFLALILIAIASYVLGMGLTVTSSYIILAILAVPALVNLGIPVIAAHLIVFWFSQDANVTPPVCLAAFAAAGIANADPMKTGWASFRFAKGLYLMPFLFAYTPILLMGTWQEVLVTVVFVTIGIVSSGAALVGYLLRKTNWVERIVLGAAGFMMFTPDLIQSIAGVIILVAVTLYQNFTRVKPQELAV